MRCTDTIQLNNAVNIWDILGKITLSSDAASIESNFQDSRIDPHKTSPVVIPIILKSEA